MMATGTIHKPSVLELWFAFTIKAHANKFIERLGNSGVFQLNRTKFKTASFTLCCGRENRDSIFVHL
jgi:hypothetical protein